MRHAAFFLMLFALHGSAVAQLQFLTVNEIFEAIDFLAAHPASPADYRSVSPFGPEADETRMPDTFADLAKSILHCYHHTARYQGADVAQTPWEREGQYGGADHSALIRIRYLGEISSDVYEINVGLVGRQHQIRTVVVSESSAILSNPDCQLENWTTLEP